MAKKDSGKSPPVVFNHPDAPGKVGQRHTHGMAQPLKGGDGIQALRDALGVSRDVKIEQLCGEAAARLVELGANADAPRLVKAG